MTDATVSGAERFGWIAGMGLLIVFTVPWFLWGNDTLVAGISLFWLFPYVMLQQIGAGGALASLTDGTVSFWLGATLITAFMIAYVVAAGMRGIAWTDTLQGAFMLLMVWAALLWVLASVEGASRR